MDIYLFTSSPIAIDLLLPSNLVVSKTLSPSMDSNQSLLSLLLSRQFPPSSTSAGAAFDSRQIFRDYLDRQINLLQWFSLIFITTLLLKQLVRLFDLRRRGNRLPCPPFQSFYGHLKLLAADDPQECLTGTSPTGQQC